jgi:DNA-binding NarL/FixJ family response regulator
VPGLGTLSTRELQVLSHLVDGERVPAIAKKLFLSQSTVRNHLAAIFSKLGVASQQQLMNVMRAAQAGSGGSEPPLTALPGGLNAI